LSTIQRFLTKFNGTLRPLFISAIMLGSAMPLLGQHSISGRVIDEMGAPLTYSNVVLLSPVDSTLLYFDVADKDGFYSIKKIKAGNYIIQYSFVTKKAIYENITIPSDLGEKIGDKQMEPSLMDEVVVTGEYVPIQFNQDTVSFNARAFSTKTGAVVEDLLKKIPGIEVDRTGNVKALGEDVTKILVDGKEFFSNDPKVATKNLPANAIERVEVFDKKSEEAEFMEIDDGVRDRTINLMLNEEGKRGYFGNVDGGGGSGSHYKGGGKIYRFSSKFQSALLGMYNNVNEFRFTGRDHRDFGAQVKGLNTTGAGGLNISYNASKSNRYYGSYLVNSTQTDLEQTTTTENFLKKGSYNLLENSVKDERNTPHKANIGIRHNFSKQHRFILNGDMSLSSNKITNLASTGTSQNDTLINDLTNTYNSKTNEGEAEIRITDILKLRGDRTQIKTSIYAEYSQTETEMGWTNMTMFYNPDLTTVDQLYQNNSIDNFIYSFNPSVVQKIKKFWDITTGLNIGSKTSALNRDHGVGAQGSAIVDSLSADFETEEMFVQPSVSLRRSNRLYQLNFTLGGSWNQFDKIMDNGSIDKTDYVHLLPGISFNSNYRKGRRIRVRYNSGVNMPSASQLLPVLNTVNKFSHYEGNMDLTPEVRHNVSFRWSMFDAFSFTSLFAHFRAGYTNNKISNSQVINDDFTRVNKPVNVDYDYTLFSYGAFSTPIRSLGMKINITNRENWNKGISLINEEDNIQTIMTHTIDMSVENRKKDIWDMKVGGSISLTDAKYTITDDNTYFNTSYYTEVIYTPSNRWTFETEASVENYNSKSFDEELSIPIINASVSYHFLKGDKSSISLQAFDLLNESVGFQRSSNNNRLVQREWNTIGRYAMLTLDLRVGK